MTRRLGGIGQKSLAAVASLSLAATLAGGIAMVGCGGDNGGDAGPATVDASDGGGSSSGGEASRDTGPDTTMPDVGVDRFVAEAAPDTYVAPLPCATPTFAPTAGAIAAGTNVVIASAMLPAYPAGMIFFTTDGTLPNHSSRVYTGGTVGVQVSAATTFQAIAYAAGVCADSLPATAAYTVTTTVPDGGGVGIPILNPAGGTTFPNAVPVGIQSVNATTICYTLDGTTPACTAAGGCQLGSTTYSSTSTGVVIPPAGSTSTTGAYTLSAIGCTSTASSGVARQIYTMQAAAPTSSRTPGMVTWTSGITTTLATITTGATVYYTTDGTMPQCGVSRTPVNGQVPLTSGTLTAIACEAGFLTSLPATFVYTVTLSPPVVQAANTIPISTALNATVTDTANLGSGDWICTSIGLAASIVAPACGVATNTCSSGSEQNNATASYTVAVPTDQLVVKAISCAPAGLSSSAVVTGGPYTLQLSAPFILPAGVTTPAAQYTIVAGGVATTIGQTGTALTPAAVTAAFACYIQNPTGNNTAACTGNGTTCAAGSTLVAIGGAGPTVNPGDTVSVILCPGTVVGTGLGYQASAPTPVQFLGVGTAGSPTISATTPPANYTRPIAPILINGNATAVTACYTTDGVTVPTCTAGTCGVGSTLALGGQQSPTLAFTITNPGSGYAAVPAVTLTLGGGGTCTTRTATIAGGAVTGITAAGCTGFTDIPTVTIAGGAGASATATAETDVVVKINDIGNGAYLAADVLTFTLTGGGGTCAGNTATFAAATAAGGATLTGCSGFTSPPTVTVAGGTGVGASATASLTQRVLVVVTAGGTGYVAVPAVTLTGGGGTCTTGPVAAIGAGAVTAISTATGCSGYTSNPTVVIAGGATATALPSFMAPIAVPMQTTGTTVKAVACSAVLTAAAATTSGAYTFTLAVPTFTPAATVNLGGTVTVATTSTFTDTNILYTTNGTAPACPATGTLIAANSGTIPAASLPVTTTTLEAIACGTNQVSSAVNVSAFTVPVAPPTISSAIGGTVLSNTGGIVNAQNSPITATISSASPGTYICYRQNGAPACNAGTANGCNAADTRGASGVTVSIGNDGTVLEAVACTAAAVSSALSTATYHLYITPVVFGAAVTACGGTTTVGFDPSAAALAQDATEGGPTPGATVCYGAFAFCGATPPNGVTCFTPAAGAYTQTATVNSSPFFAESCLTGFLGQGVAISQSETGTTAVPYAVVQTVDGVLQAGEWTATNQFASSSAGVSGGFAHNGAGTTLYLEMNGFAPAAAADTVFYISDGTATNTTTTGLGGETLAFPAHSAVVTATVGGATTGYMFNGAAWVVNAGTIAGIAVALISNNLEFSLPTADVSATGNVFVAGSFVAGFGGTPTVTGEWPQFGGAWGYVADVLTSCQPPSFYVK